MATALILPKQGNTVESCLIIAWKKQVGDAIQAGEIVLDVETDKAVVEIPSPTTGALLAQFFDIGDDVPVMTPIAVIGEAGEDVESFRLTSQKNQAVSAVIANSELPAHAPKLKPIPTATASTSEIFISPRARALAERYDIDTQVISATGPAGRIIERDVAKILDQRLKLTPVAKAMIDTGQFILPDTGSGYGGRISKKDLHRAQRANAHLEIAETVIIKGIRKTIAERMRTSLQNSAQLTLNTSADARALLAYRKRLKNSEEQMALQTISINDLLLFVVSRVLLEYKHLNATLSDNIISRYDRVHLGFAVDSERGLLVPVLGDAHNLSLQDLSIESKRLAQAVQDGRITADEMTGGTFTVSNLGALGIESFTPIINPPQVAILGVGKIDLKPVQVEEAVQFIPHLYLSLTIDHQVVDGALGARFLKALSDALANVDLWLAR